MLHIKKFTVNPFQENSYILYGKESAVLIDPGYSNELEFEKATLFLEEQKLQVEAVWLTHAHIDHVLGLHLIESTFPNLPIYMHPLENDNLLSAETVANGYGIPFIPFNTKLETTKSLEELKPMQLDGEVVNLIFAPGHSAGHVCFHYKKGNQLIGGDVLFFQSIGRTDLPGGNFETLQQSILNNIYKLPEETIVFSGHGPETSIGFEKKNNSFVRV